MLQAVAVQADHFLGVVCEQAYLPDSEIDQNLSPIP